MPPRVHRMVKEEFTVPQQLQFDLLPSSMLPLAKILDFTVPLDGIPNGTTQPAQYFSRTAPDHVDQNAILRLLDDGGLVRSGDVKKSDVEEELEAAPSAPLGCIYGKIVARCKLVARRNVLAFFPLSGRRFPTSETMSCLRVLCFSLPFSYCCGLNLMCPMFTTLHLSAPQSHVAWCASAEQRIVFAAPLKYNSNFLFTFLHVVPRVRHYSAILIMYMSTPTSSQIPILTPPCPAV
ncbi:hypothetical protein DFH08DRAFT_816770 [Mycena albidolilacea]|uniref:Uncharacterized protein n=1 Tax=Mycena albidolilacea TaxID=1033008 RepID=A0AAD6ZKP2_9AGAR|nr:hypothetical protein DFH08DRAFT_816770 [Mycena albidolilacea]